MLKKFLEHVGIEPKRVRFSWVSAAEGEKVQKLVKEFVEELTPLGPAKRFVKVWE